MGKRYWIGTVSGSERGEETVIHDSIAQDSADFANLFVHERKKYIYFKREIIRKVAIKIPANQEIIFNEILKNYPESVFPTPHVRHKSLT